MNSNCTWTNDTWDDRIYSNGVSQKQKCFWTHNFTKTCTNSLWRSSLPSFLAKILNILTTVETCQPGKPRLRCPVGIWFCWQPWGQIPWPNSLTASIYFSNVLQGMVGMLLEQGNGWERTMEVSNTSSIYPHTASISVLCTASPEEPKPTRTSLTRLRSIRSWDLHAMTLFLLSAHRMYLFKKTWHT